MARIFRFHHLFHHLGGAEALTPDEVEVPAPGPGEVRIRTRGVNGLRVGYPVSIVPAFTMTQVTGHSR